MLLNNVIVLKIPKDSIFKQTKSSVKSFLKFIQTLQNTLELNFNGSKGFKFVLQENEENQKTEDNSNKQKIIKKIKVFALFETKTDLDKWERSISVVRVGKKYLPIEKIYDKNIQKIVVQYYEAYVSDLETQVEEGLDSHIEDKLHDMRIKLNYIINYFKVNQLFFDGKMMQEDTGNGDLI